jgi:hypothetical protein
MWVKNASQNWKQRVMFTNQYKTSLVVIGQMPSKGLAKVNNLPSPRVLIIFSKIRLATT